MKNTKISNYYILYLVILIVTSAPFFIKHFGVNYFIPYSFYIATAVLSVYLVRKVDVQKHKFPVNHAYWILCVLFISAINFLMYEKTRIVPSPSTAPEALIEPAKALFYNGLNPYSVSLSDGALISPGPAWIILNSIFTLSGLITFLTPAYFIIANLFMANLGKEKAFFFSLLLLLSTCFIQLSAVGHDLPAISLAIISLTLALNRYSSNKHAFIIIAVLTGIVVTARIPFIIATFALGICLSTINRNLGLKFVALSTSVTLLTHFVFYIWAAGENLFYQPMHVFNRAATIGSLLLLGSGVLFWIILMIFYWGRLTQKPSTWLIFMWFVFAVPFIFVGAGEIVRDNIFSLQTWAAWEGKGYVMFSLPILIAGIVLDNEKPTVIAGQIN